MDKEKVLKIILGENYYDVTELRYNTKVGYRFSLDKLNDFKKTKEELIKDHCEFIVDLPLKTFNSEHIFFVEGKYLLNSEKEFYQLINDDYAANKKLFASRHLDQMIYARIFSETEGSLSIENVPTTHKRIKEALAKEVSTDKNDIIIKNMVNAMRFIIAESPAFNKDNLLTLYKMLSDNCLDEGDELKEGAYYRDDGVTIDNYSGAPVDKIDEMMDSMFAFANNPEVIKDDLDLLPHICHYYILYVHPYCDYNGRTARMVSFWLTYINRLFAAPQFISEAVNETKKAYYAALTNTREMNNDLTYFIGYLYDTAKRFSLIYKNVEEIEKRLATEGLFLSSGEKTHIKKLLAHNHNGYFNYKKFVEYVNADMTKQGALKILNQLTEYGVLECTLNKKREKIYRMNGDFIPYSLD